MQYFLVIEIDPSSKRRGGGGGEFAMATTRKTRHSAFSSCMASNLKPELQCVKTCKEQDSGEVALGQ